MTTQYIKSFIKINFPLFFMILSFSYRLPKNHFLRMTTAVRTLYRNYIHDPMRVTVIDLKSWAQEKELAHHILDTDRKIWVSPPFIISQENEHLEFQGGEATLPEISLTKLNNVTVIEGYDLILAQKKIAIYDELAQDPEAKYALRIGFAPLIQKRFKHDVEAILNYKKNAKKLPHSVIHFCKDYSYNYFHWLIEALPRLWIVEQFRELDGLPLLIDQNLKKQQLESLSILTENKREIIQLKLNNAYYVKNLYYPSSLSIMHNNDDHPIQYDSDVLISPIAIKYLREKFLSLIKLKDNMGYKKRFFLSRKKITLNPRLKNTDEIEAALSLQGFEIIYPELLSFADQVRIFSQAEVIVGAAGSAFANLIFVPEHCKVFIIGNNNRFNPYLFNMISDCLNFEIYNLLGKQVQNTEANKGAHSPFTIDVNLITNSLQQYL